MTTIWLTGISSVLIVIVQHESKTTNMFLNKGSMIGLNAEASLGGGNGVG